jgi:hypothetical protein
LGQVRTVQRLVTRAGKVRGPRDRHGTVTERPSIGAVNPALTAMSNAIRVGEHLTDRLT